MTNTVPSTSLRLAVRGVVLAVVLALFLTGCALVPPPDLPPGPDAVVSGDGFTVALDGVTVSGASTVAPEGTGVHLRAAPELVPAGLQGVESGAAFDISLEGGLQPLSPVSVSFDLPEAPRDHSTLFFVTQRSDTGEWEGLPVVVQDGRAVVTLSHLSGGWFGWGDRVRDWFVDQVKQFLKVGFPTPDCVGESVTVSDLEYRVSADGDGVHACVSAGTDRVTTTIHSATPFVWRFRPTPGEGTGQPAVPPLELAGIATQMLFQLQSGGSYAKETVLVPGGSASILLAPGVTQTRTAASVDAGLGLVAVLVAGLDMAAAMATGQDPANWLELVLGEAESASVIRDMVECMAGVIEGGQDISGRLGAVGNTVLACSGSAITRLAESAGREFLAGSVGVVVGIVTSLSGLLVTQVWGLVGELTGQNSVIMKIAGTTSPRASIEGEWTGWVSQPGSDGYNVNVTLTEVDGSWQGAVEYPELSCSGRWTMQGSSGSSVDFQEVIEVQGRCVEIVDIHISIVSADQLQYATEMAYSATATLRRGTHQGEATQEGDSASSWPTNAQEAPPGLMAWFGAASVSGRSSVGMPKWVSCTDDLRVCIAGSNSVVGVIQRRSSGFYETHALALDRPARESLLQASLSPDVVNELLNTEP